MPAILKSFLSSGLQHSRKPQKAPNLSFTVFEHFMILILNKKLQFAKILTKNQRFLIRISMKPLAFCLQAAERESSLIGLVVKLVADFPQQQGHLADFPADKVPGFLRKILIGNQFVGVLQVGV